MPETRNPKAEPSRTAARPPAGRALAGRDRLGRFGFRFAGFGFWLDSLEVCKGVRRARQQPGRQIAIASGVPVV